MIACRRWAVTVAAASLLVSACGATVEVGTGSTGPPTSPAPTGSATSPPPSGSATSRTWLAALRVAPDPDALDAETAELRDVLGGSLVVSPASCLAGLPPEVDDSDYVLGVVASDRAELDDVVGSLDREPLFEAEVAVLCTD
jgi:hypothetical protein